MAVDPNMMGAGPMIPPPPGPASAPMLPPMAPPAPAGPMGPPPAVEALPGMAALAQEQTMQMLEHERQMAAMQEKMQKDMMLLIASLPTPNPAGEAAVTAPAPPMMSGMDTPNAAY